MVYRNRAWFRAAAAGAILLAAAGSALARDKMLFDFEDEATVKAWSNVDIHAIREAEQKAAIEKIAKVSTNPATAPVYQPPKPAPAD